MTARPAARLVLACLLVPALLAGCRAGGAPKAATPEAPVQAAAPSPNEWQGPHDRPAYVTREVDGRLWIFKRWSKDLADFAKKGEPAKQVTLVGQGPGGMTVRCPDVETFKGWQHSKPGFETFFKEGRWWVFREGSLFASEMRYFGEPAKTVTLVGRGPYGTSLRSSDAETAQAWLQAGYCAPPPATQG
ncbi:MAG: hypothetical protein ACKOSS_09085 [Planctomycetia bacterium]